MKKSCSSVQSLRRDGRKYVAVPDSHANLNKSPAFLSADLWASMLLWAKLSAVIVAPTARRDKLLLVLVLLKLAICFNFAVAASVIADVPPVKSFS